MGELMLYFQAEKRGKEKVAIIVKIVYNKKYPAHDVSKYYTAKCDIL